MHFGDCNESPHKNKSLIQPASSAGLTIGDKIEKLGQHTSDTAPIFFDNVRVPQRYCIGKEGEGFKIQMHFQEERFISQHTNRVRNVFLRPLNFAR